MRHTDEGTQASLPATRLEDAQTIALKGQHLSAQGNALGDISPPKKTAP